MLVDRYRAPSQGIAKSGFVDLPRPSLDGHGVIVVHHALRLHAEDPVQVTSPRPPERRAFLRRRHAELVVELRDVPIPQECIGALHRGHPRQAELLRQAPLPSPKTPLRAASRLWSGPRDQFVSQLLHSPSNLRQAALIHLFSFLYGHEEMASTVAIQGAE